MGFLSYASGTVVVTCTGMSLLFYLAAAVTQWILYGTERADNIACTSDIALAAAILSTLAALIKCASSTFDCCWIGSGVDNKTNFYCIFPSLLCSVLIQIGCKLAALGCTVYLIASRMANSCGIDPAIDDHPELTPLIISVAVLESLSSVLETLTQVCHRSHKQLQYLIFIDEI